MKTATVSSQEVGAREKGTYHNACPIGIPPSEVVLHRGEMCSNERELGGPQLRSCGISGSLVLSLARRTGARICNPQGNGPLVAHISNTERAFGELDVMDGVRLAGEQHYCGHTDIARPHQLVRVVLLPSPQGRER